MLTFPDDSALRARHAKQFRELNQNGEATLGIAKARRIWCPQACPRTLLHSDEVCEKQPLEQSPTVAAKNHSLVCLPSNELAKAVNRCALAKIAQVASANWSPNQ